MVGGTRSARGSSVIGTVDEDQLFIGALGMVVNDFTDNNEVVAVCCEINSGTVIPSTLNGVLV